MNSAELMRPKTADCTVNFRRSDFDLALMKDNEAKFKQVSGLAKLSPEMDFSSREAVAIKVQGGSILLIRNGVVHAEFSGLPANDILGALDETLKIICEIEDLNRSTERVDFDTDLIYHLKIKDDGSLACRLKEMAPPAIGEWASKIMGEGKQLYSVGFKLFCTSLAVPGGTDVRISVEPLAKDPERKLYVHTSKKDMDLTAQEFGHHLSELFSLSARALESIAELFGAS